MSGETERATALLTESFSWWERTGDVFGHAVARSLLGGVRVSQGQYDEAAALFASRTEDETISAMHGMKAASRTRTFTSA